MIYDRCERESTYPVDLMEAVHVQLPYETRELAGRGSANVSSERENVLTLLCLKWEPRMVRLNSPTLDTTKLAGQTGGRSAHAAADMDMGRRALTSSRARSS